MKKEERIKIALESGETDRIPVSLWMHYSAIDQDPRVLAEAQVAMQQKYDFDFIKLMPFGLYGVADYEGVEIDYFNEVGQPPLVREFNIKEAKEWASLPTLSGTQGAFGKTIELAKHVAELTKGEVPFIQTVFSPLTNARKMAGDRIFSDLKEDPVSFKKGLQAITDTTIEFVKANIEAGVSGFFFATQCASYSFMTEEEYEEFGVFYDLQVINAYKDITYFNVGHIHGENTMFELFSKLPFNALNWHDRWGGPLLEDARKITDKCLIGGLREVPYFDEKGNKIKESVIVNGSKEEIMEHMKEAVAPLETTRGIMFGPGCVANQFAGDEQIQFYRETADSLKK